jgi:hypothetical protein
LHENRGLTHLGLKSCYVDDRCWQKLMHDIAEHPSLRTLSFEDINFEYSSDRALERHHTIHALAGMLASNEHVDDVKAVESKLHFEFNHDLWDSVVVPRLEINLYWKRFLAIQKIKNPATRAAVTARALAHLNSKASLQWMLLSQDEDMIVSIYLA